MVNNVIGVVNYVIAARPSLRNFVIADSKAGFVRTGHHSRRVASVEAGHLEDARDIRAQISKTAVALAEECQWQREHAPDQRAPTSMRQFR